MNARVLQSILAVIILLGILWSCSGCQTTGRALQSVGEMLSPPPPAGTDAGTSPIPVNPWPWFGALLFIAGTAWGAITRDWRTGSGAMGGGVAMGIIGTAFNHPWAPIASLILVLAGAGFAIRKHLWRRKRK